MKTKVNRFLKVILISLFVVVAALKFFGEPYLEKRITRWQPRKSHKYYNLHIGEVKARILPGKIEVKGLKLSVRPEISAGIGDIELPHLFEIETDVEVKIINAYRMLFWDEIKINRVLFKNTHLTWYPNFQFEKKASNDSLMQRAKKEMNSIFFNRLEVEDGHIIIKDKVGRNGVEIIDIDSVDLKIRKLMVPLDREDTIIAPDFTEIILSTGKFDFEYDSNSFSYDNFWLDAIHENEKDEYLIDIQSNNLNTSLNNGTSKIEAGSLHVSNLNFGDYIQRRKISIDSLIISGGEINLELVDRAKESNLDSTLSDSRIDSVLIGALIVETSFITVTNQNQTDKLKIDSLELVLSALKCDLGAPEQLTFRGTLMKSGQVYASLDPYYHLSVGGFDFTTHAKILSIDDLKLSPKYSREKFSSIVPYEQDLFTFSIDSIRVLFEDSFKVFDKEILAEKIDVYQFDIDVYRDKWVEDPPYIVKKLPSELIKSIPYPFYVKQLNAYHSTVSYFQLGDIIESELPGHFELSNLGITISNITNIDSLLLRNSKTVTKIIGRLMNASNLEAEIAFDMKNENLFFTSKGKLEALPLVRLNKFVMGIAPIDIPNGQIKNLIFELEADRDYIKGNLEMEYSDLRINVNKSSKAKKPSPLLNLIANAFVKKDNLKGEKGYKEGVIFSEVVKNKFVFNNLWQGVKSGLFDIMVISTNNQKSLDKYERNHVDPNQ